MKKLYFIYKTTNIKTNKFYIGVHETYDINDGYLGSGKRLKRSIKYHGNDNFTREILEFFDNRVAMYFKEELIVNKDLLRNKLCMNLIVGGKGGFTKEQCRNGGIYSGNLIARRLKNNPTIKQEYRDRFKKVFEKAAIDGKFMGRKNFLGKKHSEETLRKQREIKKGTQIGKSNSQYGTRWITNGETNAKLKETDILPVGWKYGRI